jgi:hypothetical protein
MLNSCVRYGRSVVVTTRGKRRFHDLESPIEKMFRAFIKGSRWQSGLMWRILPPHIHIGNGFRSFRRSILTLGSRVPKPDALLSLVNFFVVLLCRRGSAVSWVVYSSVRHFS